MSCFPLWLCVVFTAYIFGPTPYWLSEGNTACVPKIRNMMKYKTHVLYCLLYGKSIIYVGRSSTFDSEFWHSRIQEHTLPILPVIWVALQKGLEKSNTFLSASDTFLWDQITKLAFPPCELLACLTHWRQGSDGKQPIAYRVIWTRTVDHASCAEENDISFPRPTCNLRFSLIWQ